MSIEVIDTPEAVAERLNTLEPGNAVVGPSLDGGWGISTRHNGSMVHLGIRRVHLTSDGQQEGEGTLYLDPIPTHSDRPLTDVVREAVPYNCVVASLPDAFRVSRDPLNRDQAEWSVRVLISGPGRITTPHQWPNSLLVVTSNSA